MQDAISQVMSYVLAVWRRRWAALIVAWVLALLGWAYVWQMPESYVASARIYVDTNTVLRPLMRGLTVAPDVRQRISMMSRTLLSRPNLEKLARMTDLDLQVTTEAEKERMINKLDGAISLRGTRGNSSLYSIGVTHRDREMARRIAQSMITVFIETSVSDKRDDSSGAETFLKDQIEESEERLVLAESKLAAFKQKHVDVLPGKDDDYYSNLQRAKGQLGEAELELREVENRQRELERQIQGEDPVFISSSSVGGSEDPLNARIQALGVQRDTLLSRYTAKHPDVVRLQGLIAELSRELEERYKQMRNEPGMMSGAMASSPVYQGMRTMLAETEAQAAELRVRVEEYRRRVDALGVQLSRVPEVEAELKQLNRDYKVISRQHQEMLERRESARLSGDVQNNAGDLNFRVIDPPFVPLKPSKPDKGLLNVGVLLVALGGGAAVALLLALLFPIITDARMLAETTGLPLLGSVTWVKNAEELRSKRMELAVFSLCTLGLLAIFAGVLAAPGLIA